MLLEMKKMKSWLYRPMKWNGSFIIVALLLFNSCVQDNLKHELEHPSNYDIIPYPQEIIKNNSLFELSSNQTLVYDTIFKNEAHYLKNYLLAEFNIHLKLAILDSRAIKKGKIVIQNTERPLNKEGYYELNIDSDKVVISAPQSKGAFYGIQTIIQLIRLNNSKFGDKLILPGLELKDWGTFSHRGMLMDCCRHFFNVSTVKKYIDLLALYKMNTLHWHLTEDQGWRIEIEQYPKLTQIGAYRKDSNGIYGGFYTKNDIKEIIKYAEERHINIIPEIELPGHAQAALASYPELSCKGHDIEVANDWGVFKEIYCAGNDSVFLFLENVLSEVIELFPSKYIHIGGDEAPKFRWENCNKCQHRIQQEGLKDEHELQSYFIKRIADFLAEKDKVLIGWDEILEGGLADGVIVQSWRGMEGGIEAAKHGNRVIMSPTSHAYFDYDIKTTDLKQVYSFDPIPSELNQDERSMIIGGECNLWSEHIPDENELDAKAFPRLLAMTEVLWSYPAKRNEKHFFNRVSSQYSILEQLNVNYGLEVLPSKIKVKIDNDQIFAIAEPGSIDLKLKYCWNNETEYIDFENNTNTIPLDRSGNLKVQAYKKNKEYGDPSEQAFKTHFAIGKELNYIYPYSDYYPANKEYALTDSKLGSLDFRDGNWQGFWGTDLEILIDLEKHINIETISANFYQYNNSWIFFPEYFEAWKSDDNTNWTQIGKSLNGINPEKRGKLIQTLSIKNINDKVRYIKVKAKNILKVPDWHEAAGSDSWIFIDEILIK